MDLLSLQLVLQFCVHWMLWIQNLTEFVQFSKVILILLLFIICLIWNSIINAIKHEFIITSCNAIFSIQFDLFAQNCFANLIIEIDSVGFCEAPNQRPPKMLAKLNFQSHFGLPPPNKHNPNNTFRNPSESYSTFVYSNKSIEKSTKSLHRLTPRPAPPPIPRKETVRPGMSYQIVHLQCF